MNTRNTRAELLAEIDSLRDRLAKLEGQHEPPIRTLHQDVISEVGRMVLGTTSPHALYDNATRLVASAMDADICVVLELNPDGNELLLVSGTGLPAGMTGSHTVTAEPDSLAGLTLMTRETVVVEDMAAETRFSPSDALLRLGVASSVNAIIGEPGGAVGILAVHSRSLRTFKRDEIDFVKSVANILAAAVLRLRADSRLRESELRFRTMYKSSSIGISRVSLDYRFEELNPAYCDMLGYDHEELIGMSVWAVTHPDFVEESRRQQQLLRDGEIPSLQIEKQYVRKDGQAMWGLLNASLVRNDDGDPLYFLGHVVDVTARKRTEAEIRKMSVGLEQSPVSIVITDASGTIEYVNRKFCDISGYTREEASGQNPRILKSGDQPPEFYEELWATIVAGNIWRGEFHNKRKDGELFWEEATIGPITNDRGDITHFVAFKEDITDRKDLELQLLQSQRLEAIGRLAGGIAHDFNNILTVISGYGALVLEQIAEEDPTRNSIQQIVAAGERAGALTRQLLAFSRKQMIRPTILNLNSVVAEMAGMLRRLVGENIDVRTDLSDDLGMTRADPGQVTQIIMNLTVNARDALRGGGHITIETGNFEIDGQYSVRHMNARPGRYAMLAISDDGCGMDDGTRAHAFEPFFTTKAVGEGTGLGLSTVYGIVKQHNGYVWLYSEPGHGTTVKVYLPQTPSPAERLAEASDDAKAPTGSETILLVEDDDTVRNLTVGILQRAGYTVLQARDGNQAIRIFNESPLATDLLLTDVVMPGMGGKELTDQLLARSPGLRVMYVSGYTDEAISRSGILPSDVHLLSKPFHPSELLTAVREALDRKR